MIYLQVTRQLSLEKEALAPQAEPRALVVPLQSKMLANLAPLANLQADQLAHAVQAAAQLRVRVHAQNVR